MDNELLAFYIVAKPEKRSFEEMSSSENIAVVLEAFRAVERRDRERLNALYHPEVEFHWPPSFPPTWDKVETWDLLQPTTAERQMDPRVVAANDEEVVVLWTWRGVSPAGERYEDTVLGLYQVRDGKFARAQMFFFDTAALVSFLAKAARQA